MLQVACEDLGVLGCDFVARGEKVRKVEGRMLEHLRNEHPQMIAALSVDERKELERRVEAAARRD